MSIVRCFEVREAVLGRFCIISAVKKILVYRGTRRYFIGSQWGVRSKARLGSSPGFRDSRRDTTAALHRNDTPPLP